MNKEELVFLSQVKEMVKNNPKLISHIITVCIEGIEEKEKIANERAADFETIAVACMAISKENRKTPSTIKWAESLIASKMLKWENKTCINFSNDIKEIKEGIK